jgi:hypothetical protein
VSNEAINWVKTWTTEISSTEKFVLFIIADYYNPKQHRAWPGVPRIAADTNLSERSVRRQIAALEGRGLIDIEPWVNRRTGGQMSNRYCLPLFDPQSIRAEMLPVYHDAQSNEGERSAEVIDIKGAKKSA